MIQMISILLSNNCNSEHKCLFYITVFFCSVEKDESGAELNNKLSWKLDDVARPDNRYGRNIYFASYSGNASFIIPRPVLTRHRTQRTGSVNIGLLAVY